MGFNSAFNPLNAELNPICPLLALLGAHHILHVSRIRVKGLKWIFKKWNGGMNWIDLAENRDGWWVLLISVMNLRVPQTAGNFLTSGGPVSF